MKRIAEAIGLAALVVISVRLSEHIGWLAFLVPLAAGFIYGLLNGGEK